jgi:hypothetical protein
MEGNGGAVMIARVVSSVRRRSCDESGLTLIEMMLVSFLSFIVVLGIGSFQSSISKFFREGSERLRLQQNVHRTGQVIAIEVRKAHEFVIYDPVDPNTELAEGPAVRLRDVDTNTIGLFRASGDGESLVNGANERIDDMRLVDLWFERGADNSLALNLVLADKYGNESGVVTEITPRN